MIFKNPHILTKIQVWTPRYHDKKDGDGEWIVLLAKYKVDNASPWILVEFTKAKHLMGQRFCIKRSDAQTYRIEKNGKKASAIDCYAVPISKLERWDTVEEVKQIVERIF